MTSEYHSEGDISFDENNNILVYSNGQWISSSLNYESLSMTKEEKKSTEIFLKNRDRNEQILKEMFPEDYL